MRRRSFLASLLALPAVAKAMVLRPPAPAAMVAVPAPPAPRPVTDATLYSDYWLARIETDEPIRRGQMVYVGFQGKATARSPYAGIPVGIAVADARDGRVAVRHTGLERDPIMDERLG